MSQEAVTLPCPTCGYQSALRIKRYADAAKRKPQSETIECRDCGLVSPVVKEQQ